MFRITNSRRFTVTFFDFIASVTLLFDKPQFFVSCYTGIFLLNRLNIFSMYFLLNSWLLTTSSASHKLACPQTSLLRGCQFSYYFLAHYPEPKCRGRNINWNKAYMSQSLVHICTYYKKYKCTNVFLKVRRDLSSKKIRNFRNVKISTK